MRTNLHWSGAHVGENFLSGTGVLIITKNGIETLLHVEPERVFIFSFSVTLELQTLETQEEEQTHATQKLH